MSKEISPQSQDPSIQESESWSTAYISFPGIIRNLHTLTYKEMKGEALKLPGEATIFGRHFLVKFNGSDIEYPANYVEHKPGEYSINIEENPKQGGGKQYEYFYLAPTDPTTEELIRQKGLRNPIDQVRKGRVLCKTIGDSERPAMKGETFIYVDNSQGRQDWISSTSGKNITETNPENQQ